MEWIRQLLPITTLFPTKVPGCTTVFSPIRAEGAMSAVAFWKGLKKSVSLLKSRKGSSEIKRAFPSGHSTSLLISTMVALECKAFS